LSKDASQNLVVQIGSQESPCLVAYTAGSGLLVVDDGKQISMPGKTTYAILEGPSGKNEYQLRASSDLKSDDAAIGSQTCHKDWEVIEDGSRLWLRYKDSTRSSHWIASREEQDKKGSSTWSPWWLAPNGANMEDFEEYVSIDIQLVPA
jgi:hypothetical protein